MIGPPIRAAGGVVWRRVDGVDGESGVEVAVIHRPRYDDWSLPKGKVSARESDLEGAVREVLEETGFHVRVGRGLGETRYVKSDGSSGMRQKVVRWWAMQAEEGIFSATREVDELRWLSLAEAADQLTRETDREVLERFARGTAPTRTVLLVRHGLAGNARPGPATTGIARWTHAGSSRRTSSSGCCLATRSARSCPRTSFAAPPPSVRWPTRWDSTSRPSRSSRRSATRVARGRRWHCSAAWETPSTTPWRAARVR